MKPKTLKTIVSLIFLGNGLLLFISVFAYLVNPVYAWTPAFIKLFFWIFFVANALFIILFSSLKWNRLFLISFLLYLLSVPALRKMVSLGSVKPMNNKESEKLKVITANVMGFNWLDYKDKSLEIVDGIASQNPDIVVFQEYLSTPDDRYGITKRMKKKFGFKYYYPHIITHLHSGEYDFGLAIYSKWKVLSFKPIYFKNTWANGAFVVKVISPKGKVFRVFNVHLQSFRLTAQEYDLTLQLDNFGVFKKNAFQYRYRRMSSAFIRRAKQVAIVKQELEKEDIPTILLGDFNDNPISYSYSELSNGMQDAFLESGYGLGSSFQGPIPALRIDFCLYKNLITKDSISSRNTFDFQALESNFLPPKSSDHHPLMNTFEMISN